MVLAELGSKLATAMRSMTSNTVIDEETVRVSLLALGISEKLPCRNSKIESIAG